LPDVTLTIADDGAVVRTKMGDRIRLALAENPSTGYVWEFDALDESCLEVDSSDWRPAGPGVGTGGERIWTLAPRRPGRTEVRVKRWRPWAGDSSIVERIGFSVETAAG
jgi:inhibitor of cysteine peptidase